jgi:hypothetical protein
MEANGYGIADQQRNNRPTARRRRLRISKVVPPSNASARGRIRHKTAAMTENPFQGGTTSS